MEFPYIYNNNIYIYIYIYICLYMETSSYMGLCFLENPTISFRTLCWNVNCRLIGGLQESPSLIGVYVSSDHNLRVYIRFFISGWIFFRDIRWSYLCDHLMAVKAEAMVIHPFCIQNRCFSSCALFTEDCMAVVTKIYMSNYYIILWLAFV